MRLSEHFSLDEFVVSQEAVRRRIDNTPPPGIIENLRRLAIRLEAARQLFGRPVVISSGYRCPALNEAIGGSHRSDHLRGLAADFIVPGYGAPLAVCQRIADSGIAFSQLIHEYGAWVHLAIAGVGGTDRRETLTICATRDGYRAGLFGCDD